MVGFVAKVVVNLVIVKLSFPVALVASTILIELIVVAAAAAIVGVVVEGLLPSFVILVNLCAP